MTAGKVQDRDKLQDTLSQIGGAVRCGLTGQLPERYDLPYEATFMARVEDALRPGIRILDAGAGRFPTLPLSQRPPGCQYVGLDISGDELSKAGDGAYDEVALADLTQRVPELEGNFDLILSFQVMEHVKPLDRAIENLREYLRPGGRLIAQMSGKFSVFGIANQLLPSKAAMFVLTRLVGKDPAHVFPAPYHQCWHGALMRMSPTWSRFEVVPLYQGAMPYFRFSKVLRSLYLGWEEWVRLGEHVNLAAYYVVDAER